jgi:nitroreductase
MEFRDTLEARRSIRKFYPKPVEFEKIGMLIEAATRAPSVGDLQPWKFVVVTKPQQLQALADSCPYERWLYQAPLVIIVCSEAGKTEAYYPGHGQHWAALSCAAAAQNILLTAVDLDLAGCWVSSFETEKIKEHFHVPTGVEPEVMIAIGYPDENPEPKRMHSFDSMVYFNDYGATSTDISIYKKDFGEYFRSKADDVKTRLAYETAEKGGLRRGVENVQTKLKSAFQRITRRSKVTREEEPEQPRR